MLDLTKVSVIVPVYNVEKYLRECLDSLVNQTLDDIEIICVNDGSTDSSLDILNEYQQKDKRIKVFSQENQGVSSARNHAMEHITGKYTYFMDSDDVLQTNALEELYGIIEEKQLDFVIFKIINFDDETKEKQPTTYYDMKYLKEHVGEDIFSHKDIPIEFVFKIAVTPASKFYRSEMLTDIRFPEGVIFEDNVFFIETFLKADKVYFYDKYLSNKRVRKGSITHTPNESFMDFISVSEMLIDLTKKLGLYGQYKKGLFEKTISNIYLRFSQVSDDIKVEFFQKINEYFLTKKEEYENDEDFQKIDERIKEIFNSGIISQNHREFELSIKCIDLSNLLEETEGKLEDKKEELSEVKRQRNRLFNNSRVLSAKLNEFANENNELKNN